MYYGLHHSQGMNFLCQGTRMKSVTRFLCRGATSLPVATMRKPYSWFQTASCWRRIWPNWIAWRNGFRKSRRKTKHSIQSPVERNSCPLEKSMVEAYCSKWCWRNFIGLRIMEGKFWMHAYVWPKLQETLGSCGTCWRMNENLPLIKIYV